MNSSNNQNEQSRKGALTPKEQLQNGLKDEPSIEENEYAEATRNPIIPNRTKTANCKVGITEESYDAGSDYMIAPFIQKNSSKFATKEKSNQNI